VKPTVTLIINTYNQPEYLARVLRAVAGQRDVPDEVILADDGSGEETRRVFGQWAAAQSFGARHVWQEKDGFRRSRILNAAIAQAQGEYLIFLDGDTIPHPRFVGDHRSHARRRYYLQGHRVLVTERASTVFGVGNFSADRQKAFLAGDLLGIKHIFRWPIALRRVKPNYDGVRGCNLSAWRKELAEINGYSEDYIGWGCEDLDLALRLINSGVKRLDVRGQALCYHLWHPKLDRSNLAANEKLLFETAAGKSTTCERGLNLHLQKPLCTVWTEEGSEEPKANAGNKPVRRAVEAMQPSR
jgi:glycosyltransferase involved in cell wall biosynthesis